MHTDLQKASIWKRISAGLLDGIFLSVLIAFLAMLLSTLLGFDRYNDGLTACYDKYESQYGISFEITVDEFEAMTAEQKAHYDEAYAAFSKDADAIYNFNMIVRLTMLIVSFSILLGYLVLEFAIPLVFGNGQTVGKKIFAIGIMRDQGIRINTVTLFIRTVLGKFTIETMIPVLIAMMVLWSTIGILGPIIIGAILLLQLICMITSGSNSLIHDYLAHTVVVDMESQMIFDSEQDLIEYTKRIHAEKASKQVY